MYAPLVRTLFDGSARWALRRFMACTRQATQANHDALRTILALNAATDFGRGHRLFKLTEAADIETAYRAAVPLQTYSDIEPYVRRIMQGESNVLCSDTVTLLAGSAGTTSQPKRIPRSKAAQMHHLRLVVLAEQAVINTRLRSQGVTAGRGVNLMSFVSPPVSERSCVPIVSGSSAGMWRARHLVPHLWTSPVVAFATHDAETAGYLRALFALADPTVAYLQAPFAHHVTGWLSGIRQWQDRLLQDIAHGSVSTPTALPDSVRRQLELRLRPDPARAAALATALADGDAGLLSRLWPGFRYVRTVLTGSFALYADRLSALAGPQAFLHPGCHSSSEGIVGLNLNTDGSAALTLAVGAAYFEFLPIESNPHEHTVGLSELQTGKCYEVIMTTRAGLYRYRLGDVIRITGWCHEAPMYEVLYRRGTLLNLVDDQTSEWQTSRALRATLTAAGIEPAAIADYAVAVTRDDSRYGYEFFVELITNPAETALADTALQSSAGLDRALCRENTRYAQRSRASQHLMPARLRFVRSGTFSELLMDRQRRLGGSFSQLKVPRALNVREELDFVASCALN